MTYSQNEAIIGIKAFSTYKKGIGGKIRSYFEDFIVEELVEHRNLRLREKEIKEVTNILVRYTVGFGLIEVLLQDEKVQDITINSPMGRIPIFLVHQDYSDCTTNIVPTISEAESWASKLRLISGRPLDEANPILDTELSIPKANARITNNEPLLDTYRR